MGTVLFATAVCDVYVLLCIALPRLAGACAITNVVTCSHVHAFIYDASAALIS